MTAAAALQTPSTLQGTASAWAPVGLGLAHIVFGLARYRGPLRDALAAGFVGQFAEPEPRRTAFWFVVFGLPLLLAGQGH